MMGEGLGLKGCDLLLYANIMSYSKQGKEMLDTIHNLAPESISPNIPSIEECRIVDQKAMISCSEDFRLWVEGNLSVFRPILYKWTMGCALNYLRK